MILSSSYKAEMKEPILHLQLNTQHEFDSQRIVLEFNIEELGVFIDQINALKERCLGY